MSLRDPGRGQSPFAGRPATNLRSVPGFAQMGTVPFFIPRSCKFILVHVPWYSRYHWTNRAMPSSMGVLGLKPTSRIKSSTSAKVSGTSPGCMGKKFFTALRPRHVSSISIKRSSSTGWLLPML